MSAWKMIARADRDLLGEGTLWSARDNAVYWVDILAPALNRLTLADGKVMRWPMPEPIGWVVERAWRGFIAGFSSGFAELDLEPLMVRPIGDPEPEYPGNRMNDGKADADGHIWCGTMDMGEQRDCGALYRLAPDRSWMKVDGGYRVPNGPAFSPDGIWLYHSDTARRTVFRFSRGPDGGLVGQREPFIKFDDDDGYPDGMTVDEEGGLWIAHWDGGRISRFLPDGSLDRAIVLPAKRPTNIVFGGEKLDRMFVSSASTGLDPSPHDGGLFEVEPDMAGIPSNLFLG